MKYLILSLGIFVTGIFTQSCVNPICLDPITSNPPAEESWEELTSDVPGNFVGLHFINKNTGYIGGVGGVMAKTTDGGENFTVINTGTSNTIYCVHFADASTGIIAGDGLLKRTTDGGDTWTNIPFTGPGFRGSFFLTPMHGWLCGGNGYMLETTDGGATWTTLTTGTTEGFYCVQFLNENVGYAAGSSQMVLKTIDGGTTWTPLSIPGGAIINRDFHCMFFLNENEGYVSGMLAAPGDEGYIMKTTDGGATWTTLTHPRASTTFYGIAATDTDNVYFSGGTVSSGVPLFVKTTDGGSTWETMNDTAGGRLCRMQLVGNTLYTIGFNSSVIKGSNL